MRLLRIILFSSVLAPACLQHISQLKEHGQPLFPDLNRTQMLVFVELQPFPPHKASARRWAEMKISTQLSSGRHSFLRKNDVKIFTHTFWQSILLLFHIPPKKRSSKV